MTEELIIKHCSPTLAGMKTGNTFNCPYTNQEDMTKEIERINKKLASKGVRVILLRFNEDNAMLYVFRPNRLRQDLEADIATEVLRECGYTCNQMDWCLDYLCQKLSNREDFPHEIGLFLGYPPEDVKGFIEDKESPVGKTSGCCRNCKCCGYWKVYHDQEGAEKLFSKYKKCARVYWDRWAKGKPMESLTVKSA